jgi:hypothetical protein
MTVMKRVAVSKSLKFKSMGCPIIHPMTTQKGICSNDNNKDLRRYNVICNTNNKKKHIS